MPFSSSRKACHRHCEMFRIETFSRKACPRHCERFCNHTFNRKACCGHCTLRMIHPFVNSVWTKKVGTCSSSILINIININISINILSVSYLHSLLYKHSPTMASHPVAILAQGHLAQAVQQCMSRVRDIRIPQSQSVFSIYLNISSPIRQFLFLENILAQNPALVPYIYRLIQQVPAPAGGEGLLPEPFHNHYRLWQRTGYLHPRLWYDGQCWDRLWWRFHAIDSTMC